MALLACCYEFWMAKNNADRDLFYRVLKEHLIKLVPGQDICLKCHEIPIGMLSDMLTYPRHLHICRMRSTMVIKRLRFCYMVTVYSGRWADCDVFPLAL